MKKTPLLILIGALFVLGGVFAFSNSKQPTVEDKSVVEDEASSNTFSYDGEEGKDALSILKKETTVEQSSSGLVTSINGRKADDSKKEFWSFFVNGKMAEVGPAEYITKTGDKIEWKIQTY